MFIRDLIPHKDSINLIKRKIPTPKVWLEHGIEDYYFLFFFRKERKANIGYNLIIKDEKSCSDNEFIFDFRESHQVLNCIDEVGQVNNTIENIDSFVLYIKQGSSDPKIGWRKDTIVDSVIYVDKNKLNSRN